MTEEESILLELGKKFPYLPAAARMQRPRRIWVEVPPDKMAEVFAHLFGPMQFTILGAITGLDLGASLGAIYHLARTSGVMLNLSVSVPKENPVIGTVTNYFPAADAYERELVDLLGMKIEGLAPGSRYPLPDGWPAGQYPLRKDWTVDSMSPADVVSAGIMQAAPTLSQSSSAQAQVNDKEGCNG